MWALTRIHPYTHALLQQLLTSHSFLCLTAHNPPVSHLSWFPTLCSLLKMWFSHSSPVSHPSSSSSSSALPLYTDSFPQNFSSLMLLYLGTRITLLSSLKWNLKRGAFNTVVADGIPRSAPARLPSCCFTNPTHRFGPVEGNQTAWGKLLNHE